MQRKSNQNPRLKFIDKEPPNEIWWMFRVEMVDFQLRCENLANKKYDLVSTNILISYDYFHKLLKIYDSYSCRQSTKHRKKGNKEEKKIMRLHKV